MNVAVDETEPAPAETPITFNELPLSPQILSALSNLKLVTPTPVQRETVPRAVSGLDLIVQAKTGSGKTLAYGLPLLSRLEQLPNENNTIALVIAPTRELAIQICEVIRSVGSGVEPACLIGGVSSNEQIRDLDRDRRVIVGTPGRLLDFLRQRIIAFRKCQYFVVDEADEMFSMGFLEEVREILSRLPDERQGLFVSATISPRVQMLANSFLTQPQTIVIETPTDQMPSIEHFYVEVEGDLTAKTTALCDIIETQRPASAIIFCNTKSDTELVEVFLRRRGFDARRINSDLNQRQRDAIMAKIRARELQFLIGTDIAARGIDIEQIDLVINYAIHDTPETYVHRTGRTGRAGRKGTAISLVGPQDFGAFYGLKRAVAVEIKKLALPTEEEVNEARLAHFAEILRASHIEVRPKEQALAKKILKEWGGIAEPDEDFTTLMAKLYRFAIEHHVRAEQVSLEEEVAQAGPERAPEREYRRDDDRRHGGGDNGGRRRGGGGGRRGGDDRRGGSRGRR